VRIARLTEVSSSTTRIRLGMGKEQVALAIVRSVELAVASGKDRYSA
jgi:hypothetical protein